MKTTSHFHRATYYVALSFTIFLTSYSPFTSAASDDECSIWLCLPTGFIGGCEAPKAAFKRRIKAWKSPLPAFHECLTGGEKSQNNTTERYTQESGIAAQIEEYRVCIASKRVLGGDNHRVCTQWETRPAHIIKGVPCSKDKEHRRSPEHCTATLRYTEIYRNGELFGQPHYY